MVCNYILAAASRNHILKNNYILAAASGNLNLTNNNFADSVVVFFVLLLNLDVVDQKEDVNI